MAKKRNISIPDEGIEYDDRGRLKYHPDFHPHEGERLNDEDLAYLCKFYEVDSLKSLSLALGRTERTLTNKVNYLRKKGLFDYYKKKWDRLYERAGRDGQADPAADGNRAVRTGRKRMNLDRFSQGLSDPQEAKVADYCEECGGEIYDGQLVWKVGADLYCSKQCLLESIGAKTVTIGE